MSVAWEEIEDGVLEFMKHGRRFKATSPIIKEDECVHIINCDSDEDSADSLLGDQQLEHAEDQQTRDYDEDVPLPSTSPRAQVGSLMLYPLSQAPSGSPSFGTNVPVKASASQIPESLPSLSAVFPQGALFPSMDLFATSTSQPLPAVYCQDDQHLFTQPMVNDRSMHHQNHSNHVSTSNDCGPLAHSLMVPPMFNGHATADGLFEDDAFTASSGLYSSRHRFLMGPLQMIDAGDNEEY